MATRRKFAMGIVFISAGCLGGEGSTDRVSEELESTPTETPTETQNPEQTTTESPTPTPSSDYAAVIEAGGVYGRIRVEDAQFVDPEFLFARLEDSPDQFRARTRWQNTSNRNNTARLYAYCDFNSSTERLARQERIVEPISPGENRIVDFKLRSSLDRLENFEVVIGV